MCIAIVKPKGKVISKDVLRTCFENNPDGCGFAYVQDNTVYIKKFLNDFESFYSEYSKVENLSNMLIHFRIKTHGAVSLENCHPFKMNSRMALIHNGIISGYGDKENKSDTRDFIDKVLSKISHKMWKNPAFRQLVGDAIGYSKLGIIDTQGNVYIINEAKGKWDNGVWYSNSSYETKKTTYTNNYLTGSTSTKKSETTDGKKESNVGYTKSSYNYHYDYDDEYDYYNYKLAFYCTECGKVFTARDLWYEKECPKCKSTKVIDIGWIDDDKKTICYYDGAEDTIGCINEENAKRNAKDVMAS